MNNDIVVTKAVYDDFSMPTVCRKFEIVCEDKKLFVNAGWLAEMSSFFADYCFGTEYRRGSQQLVVDDIPYADMLEFMRCIFYCPYRKHLTTANVVSVLRIANRFEMRMVVARCEAFVENAAKNLDQNKLLQVAQAVKECDPNSTTMTILVDRLASLSDKDLSAMQFNDVSGDIVANVFTHRLNTKEKGKKRYCTLM